MIGPFCHQPPSEATTMSRRRQTNSTRSRAAAAPSGVDDVADDGRVLAVPLGRQAVVQRAQLVVVARDDGDDRAGCQQRARDAFADLTGAAEDDGDFPREGLHGKWKV